MSIDKLNPKEMSAIAPLFAGWEESLIWSCLQGCMGEAWADDRSNPKSARIILADFCYFAGERNKGLVAEDVRNSNREFLIMVPPLNETGEMWAREIEACYGKCCKRVERYAIKKEPGIFDENYLTEIVEKVPKEYEVRLIDEEIFRQTREHDWSLDFTSQFADYEEYHKRGLGAAVLHQGELVSGASSYTVYREGIEIEIGTREDYRRKGLASACGARLILECIKRGLYPSWDAQNKYSVGLAEKLGYHFDRAYPAYEIYGLSQQTEK
ncbi:MAG: GNAT family N-acetyltransferase [Lachnospiraceae bacterium]|nr:GNAT family N-acetyltransferase [Lachnospiraceae bacterium]